MGDEDTLVDLDAVLVGLLLRALARNLRRRRDEAGDGLRCRRQKRIEPQEARARPRQLVIEGARVGREEAFALRAPHLKKDVRRGLPGGVPT